MSIESIIISIFLGIASGLILIFMEVKSEMSRTVLIHAYTAEQMNNMFVIVTDRMLGHTGKRYSGTSSKNPIVRVKYPSGYCVDILFKFGDIRRLDGLRADIWYSDSIEANYYLQNRNGGKGIRLNSVEDVMEFIDILCECKEGQSCSKI